MLMLCPICSEEFDTLPDLCPRCECRLVPSTLSDAPHVAAKVRDKDAEFVEMCRPKSHPDAMFIKETLEQNNVPVLIQGMHSLSVMPHLAFGGQLRLLVPSDQLDEAKALYKAFFESDEGIDYIAEE